MLRLWAKETAPPVSNFVLRMSVCWFCHKPGHERDACHLLQGVRKKPQYLATMHGHDDATLTDADIEAVAAKVVAAVEKACGGRLRA